MSQKCGGGVRWWWWHFTGGCNVVGEGIDQRFPLRTAVRHRDVGMRQRTLSESAKEAEEPVASGKLPVMGSLDTKT